MSILVYTLDYGSILEPFFCSIFHWVLELIVETGFYETFVYLPSQDDVPSQIRNNPKFYPYFKDARSALDGSQFYLWAPDAATSAPHRNRKGTITQNVLAAVDWDMKFTYVLPGWEGSASDSRVYEYACEHDLDIPPGTYMLADAGFPSCNALLVPYRGIRYHLKEWAQAGSNQR